MFLRKDYYYYLYNGVIKDMAVFANKTLLKILIVGLYIYSTMGQHTSIAYTDLKNI